MSKTTADIAAIAKVIDMGLQVMFGYHGVSIYRTKSYHVFTEYDGQIETLEVFDNVTAAAIGFLSRID